MRNSILKIQKFKKENKKISMVTAYDYSTARYADSSGVDMILVGDSLSQVVLGYSDTTSITMNEMLIFTSAVSRAVEHAHLVADMPFQSFQIDKSQTVKNACELIKAGANSVKIEGCNDYIVDCIKHLTQVGIPVMGHLGFTPMSVNALGGFKIQGKSFEKTIETLECAKRLQEAGCYGVVLELMPKESAKYITQNLEIPTIGIGAGVDCDGQVLVSDDLLGKYDRFTPKFARKYANLKEVMTEAFKKYVEDVESRSFPNNDEAFSLDVEELEKFENNK